MSWRDRLRANAQTIALAGCGVGPCPKKLCARCNNTVIRLLMQASADRRPE